MVAPADPPQPIPNLPEDVQEAMADVVGTQSGTPSQQEGHDAQQDDAGKGAAGYQAEGVQEGDTTGDAVREGTDISQRIAQQNRSDD